MLLYTQILFLSILSAGFPGIEEQDVGYKVGDYVADFELKNINGEMVSLSDRPEAEGYVIIFTCNHCPYSKLYQERIININNKYAPQGYPVLAINPNDAAQQPEDSFEAMRKRAKEMGYTFPYLMDKTQEVAKAFGATRTPQAYVLKKEGNKYKVVYIGAIDDNFKDESKVKKKYVENALNQLIAGKKVTIDFTKTIGCSIKWKNT